LGRLALRGRSSRGVATSGGKGTRIEKQRGREDEDQAQTGEGGIPPRRRNPSGSLEEPLPDPQPRLGRRSATGPLGPVANHAREGRLRQGSVNEKTGQGASSLAPGLSQANGPPFAPRSAQGTTLREPPTCVDGGQVSSLCDSNPCLVILRICLRPGVVPCAVRLGRCQAPRTSTRITPLLGPELAVRGSSSV
jgi:hypothetical protein